MQWASNLEQLLPSLKHFAKPLFVISNAVVYMPAIQAVTNVGFTRKFVSNRKFAFIRLFRLIAAWAYFFLLDKKEAKNQGFISLAKILNAGSPQSKP